MISRQTIVTDSLIKKSSQILMYKLLNHLNDAKKRDKREKNYSFSLGEEVACKRLHNKAILQFMT